MTPETYLQWLEEEIKKEEKLSRDMVFGYSSKAPAFRAAKEKFLTIEFNTPSTDNENSFTEGLE